MRCRARTRPAVATTKNTGPNSQKTSGTAKKNARMPVAKCRPALFSRTATPSGDSAGWLHGPGTFTMNTTWFARRIAIANAKNNFGLDEENLYVASVFVGDGLRIKRFTPKAFGRATPIIRRSSNVKIVLEEREEGKNRRVVEKQEIVTVKDEAGLEEVVSTKEEKKIGSDERKKDVKPQAVRAVKKVFQRKAA